MDFTFYSAGEIIFGSGKIADIGNLAARYGTKAMICYRGTSMVDNGILDRINSTLSQSTVDSFSLDFSSQEPTVEDIDNGVEISRKKKPHVIIGIGGGSTIDTAKAISGLTTNPGSVLDYLEGVGKGLQIQKPSIPYIAIPTTAGTGAEVTKNAVISSRDRKFKKSIRSPWLIPDIALLDPELTLSLPKQITAETGMDALTQLVESYISAKAQPMPSALAIYGIRLAGQFLERAVTNGSDLQAREGMMLASLLSGLALANSGLGAAHGIAAALGAIVNVPHGRACAMLLPKVLRVNHTQCQNKYAEISDALHLGDNLSIEDKAKNVIQYIEDLCDKIDIPKRCSIKHVDEDLVNELVMASQGSSMKGNPILLTDAQIRDIITSIL